MPRVLPSTSESMRPAEIPPALRDDLLTYLFWTSPDRARITFDLYERIVEVCGWPR